MLAVYIYLSIAVLVAIRVLISMLSLDRFDWKHDRMQIWVFFGLTVLLWPVVLFTRPSALFSPNLRSGDRWLAQRERDMHEFVNHPPPCASRVAYRPRADDGQHGEFFFDADMLEQRVQKKLADGRNAYSDQYLALLAWLRQRDHALAVPTDIPAACSHFDWIADAAIRSGEAEVRCTACKRLFL